MTPWKRITRNTATLIILRIASPALSMLVVLAVSRALGAEGLGRYTLAFTYLMFFCTLTPLGLGALIARDGARRPGQMSTLLVNAGALATIAAGVLWVGMAASGFLLGYDHATAAAIALASVAIVPATLGALFEGGFIALERMEFMAIVTFVENALRVGAGVLVLWLGYGLDSVIVVAVVSRIVSAAVAGWLLVSAGVSLRPRLLDRAVMRELAGLAPTFLLTAVFATLFWRIDMFMLSMMRPVDEVGEYGAAWRLLEIALVVPQSLCLSLYPHISGLLEREPEALPSLARSAGRYMTAASLPVCVVLTFVAKPVLGLLYGPGFDAAAPTLCILMWTLIPYGVVRFNAYLMVGANHQRVDLLLNVVLSVVNVLMNLVLIPAWGHLGAAVSTLVSVALFAAGQRLFIRRELPNLGAPLGIDRSVVLATAVCAAAVFLLRGQPLAVTGTLALACYAVALVAGGFFTARELALFGFDRMWRPLAARSRS